MADRSEHASRTDQSGLHSHIGLIPPDKSAGACAGTCPYHRQTGHNPKTSNGRVGDNPTGTWKQASHPQLNERFAPWLLKNSLSKNPQKLDRVRMPYKRFAGVA
jgi:hypothetical protein